MGIIYRIKDWDKRFENNRSRELKNCTWLPLPNALDEEGYAAIMELEDGPAIYGCWIACAQIASRCDVRGTLLRADKTPHTSHSLARISRMGAGLIERMLKVCSSPDVSWLECVICEDKREDVKTNPAGGCGNLAGGCLEGKEGKEGKEDIYHTTQNQKPQKEKFKPPTEQEILTFINHHGLKINPVEFIDFYESKGWMIGKNRMKNWEAAVRRWARNGQNSQQIAMAARRGPNI